MKSLILSFLLILGLATPNIAKPINDIYSIKEPSFAEEAYVNDIPFDTYEIAVGSILEGDEVKLEDEAYVNDIPFDTRAIAGKYLLRRMIETSYELNVNDIPFSTEKILYEQLVARLTEKYRNEIGTNDIPEALENNFCCYEMRIPRSVLVLINATGKEAVKQ
jgi:hypothetical protein